MSGGEQYRSFVSAVRHVLASESTTDMRAIAGRAVALLDANLVAEAAITHLAGLARREWNRSVRENGVDGVSSDEIVSLRGRDALIGETDQDDREWLASNRERLADGLKRRAAELRECGTFGPGLGLRLTRRKVLDAERRAQEVENMVAAIHKLVEGVGTGCSKIEMHVAEKGAELDARYAKAIEERKHLLWAARHIGDAGNYLGRDAARARRAARRLAALAEGARS